MNRAVYALEFEDESVSLSRNLGYFETYESAITALITEKKKIKKSYENNGTSYKEEYPNRSESWVRFIPEGGYCVHLWLNEGWLQP